MQRTAGGVGWGRWLGVHVTLLGYVFGAASPVLADAPAVRRDLPRESATEFDASRWYRAWWTTAKAELPSLPGTLARELDDANGAVAELLRNGVVAGDTLVVVGGPEAAANFRHHAAEMGIHFRDSVVLLPDHVGQAGGQIAEGHLQAVHATSEILAEKGAARDVVVARSKAIKESTDEELAALHQGTEARREEQLGYVRGEWSNSRTRSQEGVAQTLTVTQQRIRDAHDEGIQAVGRVHREGVRGTGALVEMTLNAPGIGARTTRDATEEAAAETTQAVGAQHVEAIRASSDAASAALEGVDAAEQEGSAHYAQVKANIDDGKRSRKLEYAARREMIEEETLSRIGPTTRRAWTDTTTETRRLHTVGQEQYLKTGLQLAGDNFFAGDVEGAVVGSFYSVASVVQGVGFLLVLEPMAFVGNFTKGVLETGALAGRGAGSLALLDAAAAVGFVVSTLGGAAMTVGVGLASHVRLGAAVMLGMAHTTFIAGASHTLTALFLGLGVAELMALAAEGVLGTGAVTATGAAATAAWSTVGVGTAYGAVLGATAARFPGSLVMGAAEGVHAALSPVATALGRSVLPMGSAVTGQFVDAVATLWLPTWGAATVAGLMTGLAMETLLAVLVAAPFTALGSVGAGAARAAVTLARDPVLALGHLAAACAGGTVRLVTLGGVAMTVGVTKAAAALFTAHAKAIHYGITGAAGGIILGVENASAPFRFDKQLMWRREREPQLNAMLARQPSNVTERIGLEVAYVRVLFSGPERGKVNFFETEKNGRSWRFNRHVQADCEVVYVNPELTLHSETADGTCVDLHTGSDP